ncbi:hypothetical protein LTI14_10790 [Nesterenkonia sp. YGD6]|uniref:hypothetical protein n=1 Tax=Nesterenkonia sp. YGD6 TaxID=2901231 RepID=UPI001F4D07D0|nr:hypothetical protein [Nesterenkonia sp. YGD6]MCH8563695.1 hypothetical protein [Nesterenkonia sp. YGD6]
MRQTRGHLRNRIKKHNPRLAERVTVEIFTAVESQTVVVADTEASATIVPILAQQLQDLTRQQAGASPK